MVTAGKNPVVAGSLPNNNSRTTRPKKNQDEKRGGGLNREGKFYGYPSRMGRPTNDHPNQ